MTSTPLQPWMHAVELSQVLAALIASGARRVLEWGAGGSTLALLQAAPFIERYVSVEHDAAWYKRVREAVDDPRLELHWVPPDRPPSPDAPPEVVTDWAGAAEFDATLLAGYVALPETLDTTFGFVLVDGRARRFCIETGFRLLEPGGTLVIHDAQRTEYHDVIHAQPGLALFLEPWHQGQVCLLHKPRA